MITIKINPEKIRDVIGKGGAVIRALTEETGTTIDIEDDGTVTIASVSAEGGELAQKRIEDITAEVEVGKIYEGTVLQLLDFGAIVQRAAGQGRPAAHLADRQRARQRASPTTSRKARSVKVKVLEADDKGRVAPVDEGGGGGGAAAGAAQPS